MYIIYVYQACDNGLGDCAAGLDVDTCERELAAECGSTHVKNLANYPSQ